MHTELKLEGEFCDCLSQQGWIYEADARARALALFPEDVLACVQAMQPKAWKVFAKNHGNKALDTLMARLRDQLDQCGSIDLLCHGIKLPGGKAPHKLANFKLAEV